MTHTPATSLCPVKAGVKHCGTNWTEQLENPLFAMTLVKVHPFSFLGRNGGQSKSTLNSQDSTAQCSNSKWLPPNSHLICCFFHLRKCTPELEDWSGWEHHYFSHSCHVLGYMRSPHQLLLPDPHQQEAYQMWQGQRIEQLSANAATHKNGLSRWFKENHRGQWVFSHEANRATSIHMSRVSWCEDTDNIAFVMCDGPLLDMTSAVSMGMAGKWRAFKEEIFSMAHFLTNRSLNQRSGLKMKRPHRIPSVISIVGWCGISFQRVTHHQLIFTMLVFFPSPHGCVYSKRCFPAEEPEGFPSGLVD